MSNQISLIYWTSLTGIISCLITGVGAVPVHFVKNNSRWMRAFSSAFASGMMISAAVFSLAQEGIALKTKNPWAPYEVIAGLLLGAAFFWWTSRLVEGRDWKNHNLARGISQKGILIFIAMFIHSIPEGIAIGVGFATGNFHFGLVMAIAIAVHNIPEGIAVSLPLKKDGASTVKCAWASILTSLPQPLLAAPSALLGWFFEPFLGIGLGFAGGSMIYLVMAEMVPGAVEEGGKTLAAWGIMLGLCTMLLLTNLIDLLPNLLPTP
ncbi:MAG: ZIP family metal transporter [Candidatus Omnitrophica bacterium]|nr:ZIP family metal transporter [Candidatus Omnitrophota bacterium]MDE2010399.1 ZIP family metal transporter [Candidatus Omnitrophota bacterium]MDE2214754.1 ZIP family metal transporter [Candidatus Omnitrophota bacterium]MDE2231463.1 ZIP family metal transporter [Candidatus Omnitrophota bacterium]